MKSKILSVFVSVALVATQVPVFAQGASARVDLAAGIRQVEEGDFDSAIGTLDRVVKVLASERGTSKDLAKAYLYLAIANLGLSQEAAAKARLLDALAADKSLSLSPDQYPPNVIKLFNEVRREAGVEVAVKPQPTPASEKKGGSKLPFILGGAAVAGGVGFLALKGGNKAPNPGTLVIVNADVTPIAAASEVAFRLDGASDPDGDALSYYWQFGDGIEEQGGPTAAHIYEAAGDFLAVATVDDGKKSAEAKTTVRVRDLTGTWSGTIAAGNLRYTLILRQEANRLTGTYSDNGSGAGIVEDGRVSMPRIVMVRSRVTQPFDPSRVYGPVEWLGEIEPSGNRIIGRAEGFTGGSTTFVWMRN